MRKLRDISVQDENGEMTIIKEYLREKSTSSFENSSSKIPCGKEARTVDGERCNFDEENKTFISIHTDRRFKMI